MPELEEELEDEVSCECESSKEHRLGSGSIKLDVLTCMCSRGEKQFKMSLVTRPKKRRNR